MTIAGLRDVLLKKTAVLQFVQCPKEQLFFLRRTSLILRWETASEFPIFDFGFLGILWLFLISTAILSSWLSHRPHLDYKCDKCTPLFLIHQNQSIMFVAPFELVLTNAFWTGGRHCWRKVRWVRVDDDDIMTTRQKESPFPMSLDLPNLKLPKKRNEFGLALCISCE